MSRATGQAVCGEKDPETSSEPALNLIGG